MLDLQTVLGLLFDGIKIHRLIKGRIMQHTVYIIICLLATPVGKVDEQSGSEEGEVAKKM